MNKENMDKAVTQSATNEEAPGILTDPSGSTYIFPGKKKKQGIQVFYPPLPVPQVDLFLGGSIEMGKADPWQNRICEILMNRGMGLAIANPRREDWDSSWEQSTKDPNFVDQVNWELNALQRSDLIVMYFQPGTISPVSLLELGLYVKRNMIVYCPEGFHKKGNVDIVCARFGITVVDTEEALVDYIVEWFKPSALQIPNTLISNLGRRIIKKDNWKDLVDDLPMTKDNRRSAAAMVVESLGFPSTTLDKIIEK